MAESTAHTYKAPGYTTPALAFCAVAFMLAALVVLGVAVDGPSRDWQLYGAAAFFGGFSWIMGLAWWQSLGYAFVIADQGFAHCRRGDTPPLMPWSRVAAVRASRLVQRLNLLDAGGKRLGFLEYQVAHADSALAAVLSHVQLPHHDRPVVFKPRLPWFPEGTILAMWLCVGVVPLMEFVRRGWRQDTALFGLLWLLSWAGWAWVFGRGLRRTIVARDELILHKGRDRIGIPWDQVLAVSCDSVSNGRGGVWFHTYIATQDGDYRRVDPLGTDVCAVYLAIEAARRATL